jgi:hypothetical protein
MRRLLLIGVLALAGCSRGESGTPLASLDQLPPGHLQKAQDFIRRENHPDVKFESASKLGDGTYEIRGRDGRGKQYEVEIHPDGRVEFD